MHDHRSAFESLEPRILLCGVTLITHGNSLLDTTWVSTMSNAVEAAMPGGSATVYKVTVYDPGSPFTRDGLDISATLLHAGTAGNGEVIIQLDWSDVSGVNPVEIRTTPEVASVVVPELLNPAFLPGLGIAAAALPIHLIGHSRGGSLVSEISRGLGEQGVWVDQMTVLDTGNEPPLDAIPEVWSNIVFADNYSLTYGLARTGAFNEFVGAAQGGTLPGGYPIDHMDVPVWYYGTVDPAETDVPYQDGVVINDALRDQWYIPAEEGGAMDGWFYSRTGGGNRTSAWSPGGASNEVRDGLSVSFGGAGTRQPLDLANAVWCNADYLRLAKSQFLTGESAGVSFLYQDDNSGVTVDFYLDSDRDPLDGGLAQVGEASLPTTGSTPVAGAGSLSFNVAPGTYYLAARITDGTHVRYAYVQDPIGIVAANHAPVLDNGAAMKMGAVGLNETTGRGTLVTEILRSAGSNPITDSDPAARQGIAVTAADASHGIWQYTLDGGITWSSLGSPSSGSARLLAADAYTRLRFIPASGFSGAVPAGITFRAWDLTTGVNGGTADVGGSTAFSASSATAGLLVVAPDAYEPAYSFLDASWFAADITPGPSGASAIGGLTIDTAGNGDWYKFTVPYGATGEALITLTGVNGLLFGHLGLYNQPLGSLGYAPWGPMLQADATAPDQDVTLDATGLTGGSTYWLKVNGWLGTQGVYTLSLSISMIPSDRFEPNDSPAAATDLTAGLVAGGGSLAEADLSIHRPLDEDWFQIDTPAVADGNLTATVSHLSGGLQGLVWVYQHYSWGDVPVAVGVYASWMPGGAGQAVVYNAQPNTTYFVRVEGFYPATGGYRLDVTLPLDPQAKDDYEKAGVGNGASWFATPVTLSGGGATVSNLSIYKSGCTEWFAFTLPASGSVQVTVNGVAGGLIARIGLYDSVLGTLSDLYGGTYTTLFGPAQQAVSPGADQAVTMHGSGLLAYTTHYVRVSGDAGTTGLYSLDIQFTPATGIEA